MYAQGQLVRNTVDGSRPGYSGEKKLTKTMEKRIATYDEWAKKNNKPLYKSGKLPNWKTYDIREGNWTGGGKGEKFKDPAFIKAIRSEGSAIQQVRDYLNNSLKQNKGKPLSFKTIPEIKKLAGVTKTGKGIDGDISRALTGMFKDKVFLRNFDKLPDEVIAEVKTNFSDIISKDQWNFDKYRFGVNKEEFTNKVYDRIRAYVQDPKPTRYGFGFSKPEGWMLVQMDRAWRSGNKNYKPIYRTDGRVIGYVDNTASGQGKKWFVSKDYIKGKNSDGLLLGGGENYDAHLDFTENKKYHDIVQKAGKQPNRAITQILKDGGIDQKVQLRHIVNYLLDNSDLSTTKNSIVRHHRGSLQNATQDLQILNRVQNAKVIGIEKRIKDGIIKPDDIAKLNRFGVSVRDPNTGTLYGKGPTTAKGGLKKINELVLKGSTNKELYGKDIKGLQDFKKKDFKQLAGYLEKLGCGQAAGGRILFSKGTPGASLTECGKKGVARFIDDLKSGNYSKATKDVLKSGGQFIKGALNPMELLKLRNLIGPAAMGFMAAFEGGVITDDVIRQGTPLNESLANNWLTKSFLPYTKDYAQAKNLLESGTVPSNMKKYVQDVVTFNEGLKEVERIENMTSSRIADVGDYGMIDGSSMYSKEQEDKDVNKLIEKMSTISEDVVTPGTAKALEMKALQDEMEATRMAKKEFSPIFSFDKLKDVRTPGYTGYDYVPDEQPVDLRPITYKDAEYKDTKLPLGLEQAYMKQFNLKPRDSLSKYTFEGSDKNVLQELTDEYNMAQRAKQASMYPGYYGANEKFSEGGIASLNVNKK